MYIEKRDGNIVEFSADKIKNAIIAAWIQIGTPDFKIVNDVVKKIKEEIIELDMQESNKDIAINVECVENIVMSVLFKELPTVAREYSLYKLDKERAKKNPAEIEKVLYVSDEVNSENANKNVELTHIKNAYLAEIPSKEMMERLLPRDCWEAHKKNIVYFHDSAYSARSMENCRLLNLDELLQNGFELGGRWIEKPKSFLTACTIVTQILSHVTGGSYGGCTINLLHLAKFVDVSRKKIEKEISDEINAILCDTASSTYETVKEELVNKRLQKEIEQGMQCFDYQNSTLCSTVGQAVFLTVSVYLNEDHEYTDDLILIFKEMLKQRIKGIKDKSGAYVNPNFPKILYFLDEDTMRGGKYYDVTRLCAECSAKRLVPDYMSVKKHIELKGICTPSMGCVSENSIIDYKINDRRFVESFKRAWDRLSKIYDIKIQPNQRDFYIETKDVYIYDNKSNKYVKQNLIIKNNSKNWVEIVLSGGRYINTTIDHPFETENRGTQKAEDLIVGDKVSVDKGKKNKTNNGIKFNRIMWLLGLILCDGSLSSNQMRISLSMDETEIIEEAIKALTNLGVRSYIKEHHRETKGNYYEVCAKNSTELCNALCNYFEGNIKKDRHIPNQIFSTSYENKMSFLAGMIDADGYVNDSGHSITIQIGSTNEELALQQAALAQDVGYPASVYINHYDKNDCNKIRYRVEFECDKNIISYMICLKKKKHFNESHLFLNNTITSSEIAKVIKITKYEKETFSYDVNTDSEHFMVNNIYSHNCRALLSPWVNPKTGQLQVWGRANMGVQSLNLPYIAMENNEAHSEQVLFQNLDKYLDIAYRDMAWRINHVAKIKAKSCPLMWVYGGIARLNPEDNLESIVYGGYYTVSLGYSGLYECVKYITNENHWESNGKKLAIKILDYLNKRNNEFGQEMNVSVALYGTPSEVLTTKFAEACLKEFGQVGDGTQRHYLTNSYHIPVFVNVDAFTKLTEEAAFSDKTVGGSISYVEVPNLSNNIEAVLEIIEHIGNTSLYAELNSEVSQCENPDCMFSGYDFKKIQNGGTIKWQCPVCGETERVKTSYRVCGYISNLNGLTVGRASDIHDRKKHLN